MVAQGNLEVTVGGKRVGARTLALRSEALGRDDSTPAATPRNWARRDGGSRFQGLRSRRARSAQPVFQEDRLCLVEIAGKEPVFKGVLESGLLPSCREK
jgi:hypothetical protein